MSLLTGETVQFEFPQKPSHTNPFDIAEEMVDWTRANAPYQPCNFYRPEMAIKHGAVNCYGVAQAVVQLAEKWGYPAAIALDKEHAAPFIKIGEILFCIETIDHEKPVRTMEVQVTRRADLSETCDRQRGYQHRAELNRLYKQYLPEAMHNGQFSIYFEDQPFYKENEYWIARPTDTIRTLAYGTLSDDMHIIVDAVQGAEMLCAIGDLKRYKETDPERYEEMLPELLDCVPDFIDLRS